MNYDRSGQFGAPRRKAPPSMPVGAFSRDVYHAHSDISPSELIGSAPTFAQKNFNNQSITHSWGLKDHPLAMVYSPLQAFSGLYDEEKALSHGTLFSELDLPFEGYKCRKERC